MYIGAGQATGVGSIGGSVDILGGGSASTGGDVNILSGFGEVTSGKVVIASNDAISVDSASGDVIISSGSSSGTQESGSGERSCNACLVHTFHYKQLTRTISPFSFIILHAQ